MTGRRGFLVAIAGLMWWKPKPRLMIGTAIYGDNDVIDAIMNTEIPTVQWRTSGGCACPFSVVVQQVSSFRLQ